MNPETGSKPKKNAKLQETNLKNLSADSIDAQVVQMHQSGASRVQANSVEAVDSFLGEIHTQSASLHQGITAYMQSDQVAVDRGFTGVLSTNDAVVNGTVGVTVAQSVRMNESRSGILVAREVHGAKMHTVFLITGRMDAPVETVVEPRSIALFGAAAGLVFGIVYGIFRWLRSNR